MLPDDRVRLQHMLDAVRSAISYTKGRSRADLDQDELLGLALVRLLEIIGEAAKKVSEPFKSVNPQIAWRQIGATRDRLIHGYFDVDHDIVWEIVKTDLPNLILQLEELFDSD